MEKLKSMDKKIFMENLISAVCELQDKMGVDFKDYKFIIKAVREKDKPLNAEDEIMRLILLSPQNADGRMFTLENTIKLLGGFIPFVPIWINVSFVEMKDDTAILQLDCSCRLRKPSLLRNVENGHPPFRIVF